jgi:hypothetical protein
LFEKVEGLVGVVPTLKRVIPQRASQTPQQPPLAPPLRSAKSLRARGAGDRQAALL